MAPRRLAIVLAGLALAVVAFAAVALAADTSPKHEAAQLLRLNDLPLGYQAVELQEDRGQVADCEALTEPEDTPPRMLAFIRRYHPRGCIFGFQFTYAEPKGQREPLFVGTGVLDAKSTAEAKAGVAVVPEMLGRLLGDKVPRKVAAPTRVGAQTLLFHSRAAIAFGGTTPVSFLVWRSGSTLAAVMVAGPKVGVDDKAAATYAARQQAHVTKPTRLRNSENYDAEVALENPARDLPVLWLGRTFAPGGGLPELKLGSSWFFEKPVPERVEDGIAERPLPKLRLTYYSPNDVTLSTWGPDDWSTYTESKTGKAIVTWKCTQAKTVAVEGGTATIYGGYAKDFAKCPKTPPRAFTAWIRYGEDTVVVDEPFAADSIELVNPYGSFAAMEKLLAALHPRPDSNG
jgi:hypothetical protein